MSTSPRYHRTRRVPRIAARTPNGLRELQRLMAAALMRPLNNEFQMQSQWTDGCDMRKIASSFIKRNERLSSFERLEIYNRQYWFRVLESLHEDYPGLRAVLGKRRFLRLVIDYLAAHPSTSFTLRNLGKHLVSFIEACPHCTSPRHRLALGMARLEWAHIEAFENAAEPPLLPDDILDAGTGKLRLRLQPHLTLLALNYPLDDFLIALRHVEDARTDASNAVTRMRDRGIAKSPPLRPSLVWLAVHRYRNCVHYKRLTRGQFLLLEALAKGLPLTVACETCWSNSDDENLTAETLQAWFSDWAMLGWFCRCPRIGSDAPKSLPPSGQQRLGHHLRHDHASVGIGRLRLFLPSERDANLRRRSSKMRA